MSVLFTITFQLPHIFLFLLFINSREREVLFAGRALSLQTSTADEEEIQVLAGPLSSQMSTPCKFVLQNNVHVLQVADLSIVAAQAAAQVERAREAVRRQAQKALSSKPKLQLHVTLDAPKVAVPIPAAPDDSEGLHPSRCRFSARDPWDC